MGAAGVGGVGGGCWGVGGKAGGRRMDGEGH